MSKISFSVHKFSSCDGCQLALLNLGGRLLQLMGQLQCLHFAEAGLYNPDARVDVALVEGSVCTAEDQQRIQSVRESCRWLVTIGACATAGGIQALRNGRNVTAWTRDIYADSQYIDTLDESHAISSCVRVDYQLWGCPVSSAQVVTLLRQLQVGVAPRVERDRVCMECKARQQVCVMVARGEPCMGPLTRGGCGALCPSLGRDCYACSGAAEGANTAGLRRQFVAQGLDAGALRRRFRLIHDFGDTDD